MPYLPSLKKFWFETFNFRRFCISNRQSSTTIPEKKGFFYKYYSICFHFVVYNSATTLHYCIDTDEIPGFFLLLKNHIFIACSEDTIFIFHVSGHVRILVSPWLQRITRVSKSCVLCRNFISIYKINRRLHGHLGIWILSSSAESISHEWV